MEKGKHNGDNNDGDNDDVLSFEEEWRVVAMTFDRVMLISFSVIFIIGTIACFAHTKYVV